MSGLTELPSIAVSAINVPVRRPADLVGGPDLISLQVDGAGSVRVSFLGEPPFADEERLLDEDAYNRLRGELRKRELAELPPYARLYPQTQPNGNTQGRVVGEIAAANVPASQANPPVAAETAAEADTGSPILDGLQLGLDALGLIPGAGELADLANAGISLARGDYAGAALSAGAMIPFAGWGATAGKVVRKVDAVVPASAADNVLGTVNNGRKAADDLPAPKSPDAPKNTDVPKSPDSPKNTDAPPGKGDKDPDGSNGGDKNGKDGGKGKDDKCVLRTYNQGCPGSKTPHHIVPDRVFKMPSQTRIPNGLTHGAGLCICVDGASPKKKGPTPNEHGRIHSAYDAAEAILAEKGTPKGTATLGEIEAIGVMSAAAVTGCNPLVMASQVRAYHQSKGLSIDDRFRADGTGKYTRGMNASDLGTKASSNGQQGL